MSNENPASQNIYFFSDKLKDVIALLINILFKSPLDDLKNGFSESVFPKMDLELTSYTEFATKESKGNNQLL